MDVIAHRGASAYAPENTFSAFDRALELGSGGIETDVRASKDGKLVLIHDAAVDRTSNGSGAVAGLTYDELSLLDFGGWFDEKFRGEKTPLLDEFLERYGGRIHLTLEIKARGIERTLAGVIKKSLVNPGGYEITSFDRESVLKAMELIHGASAGLLVKDLSDENIRFCLENNISQICPRAENITPESVREAHSRGLAVRAWGVPDTGQMKRAAETGIDGMTVDFPDKLISYINSLNPA